MGICLYTGKGNAQISLDTFMVNVAPQLTIDNINDEYIKPLVMKGYFTAFGVPVSRGKWIVIPGRKFSIIITDEKTDSLYSLINFNKSNKKWISLQNDNGYPFASLEPVFTFQRGDTIGLKLNKSFGEQWHYDSLDFDNLIFSPLFIKWAGKIKLGDAVSKTQNDLLLQRLYAIRGLTNNGQGVNYLINGKSEVVRFPVKKIKRDIINGIIGLNSNAHGERTVTGELGGEFYNMMGSGAFAAFKWQSFRARSQEFNVEAEVPYIFGAPFVVRGAINFEKFDTIFTNTYRELGINLPLSQRVVLGFSLSANDRNRISLNENIIRATQMLPSNPNSRNRMYGGSISYKWGDESYFSDRQIITRLSASVGTRELTKDSRIALINWQSSVGKTENVYDSITRVSSLKSSQFKMDFMFNAQKGINSLLVARVFSNIKILRLPNIFLNELYRFGGINSLLGFNEQSIFANQFYSGGLELRLKMGVNSFLGAQANIARYINETSLAGLTSENIYGLGITSAITTRAGILQIAIAMGQGASSKFGFNQTKFHFGLVTNI